MKLAKLVRRISTIVLAVLLLPANALADPAQFFPSLGINEDDRLDGEYFLNVEDCKFELTVYVPTRMNPSRIKYSTFDLAQYETNPLFVNAPYPDAPLSTRHNVLWFAKSIDDIELAEVSDALAETRLTFQDRRDLSSKSSAEKLERLGRVLEKIEAGEFGSFAEYNYSTTYLQDAQLLTSVRILRAFVLPVERDDAQALIAAIDLYRSDNCSEIGLDDG